ncbi:MAG TPA: glycosyltransferase family 4 protein [Vicinamibacterales bacterium]|nr:glycosyltransferase family 4 protein [Vicinamibacterales bacterium]
MTVLCFADTRFPIERANGLQTMATCHALAAEGHDVTLVVRPDTAASGRDPFSFYDLPSVSRLRIETIGRSRGKRANRIRFLLSSLKRATERPDATVWTRDLGLAAFLLQLPAARRPTVVYESHGIAPIVSEELPTLLGHPDLAPTRRKLERLDARERRVWRRAPAYVTITKALADDLAARYGPRPNVFVVPDGAALDRAPGETQPESLDVTSGQSRPCVAGYAGHLYPWKGVDVLIRALAIATGVRGLIVGGHPGERDRARIDALVGQLGLGDRVEITGLVPFRDVRSHLQRASILVLPNSSSAISERYTSPLKLFEYLALGRPIVASDLPAIREVLTHERTALLVPPDDPAALGRALERLAGDATLAETLGRAAHALASHYTWAQRARRLEAALEAARPS